MITYKEVHDEEFKKSFLETIEGYDPPILPKIIRTYRTNTGCVVNHTCILMSGKDYSNIVIGSPHVNTEEEEEFFKKFFPADSELFFSYEEKEPIYLTHIANREELVNYENEED